MDARSGQLDTGSVDTADPVDAPEHDAMQGRSLVDDVLNLVQDGKLYAEAEIDFHKKRAIYGASAAGGIAARFVVAAVFAFFALMALVVGLILALGQVITYWGSTAVVTLMLLIGAAALAKSAKSRMDRLKTVISDGLDE